MNFKKYTSIETINNQKILEQIIQYVDKDIVWNATEKVHGSNFSATTDGNTILWGKRTCYLDPSEYEKFYNCHYVVNKYNDNVMNLYHMIQSKYPTKELHVFGELCGGGFKDLPCPYEKKIAKVQKDIEYTPYIEFVVFDIRCDSTFLPLNEVIMLCEQVNIPCVKILHRGKLEELLQLNPDFVTMIPSLFGLEGSDIAEGYVLRPDTEQYLLQGGRVILKHKSSNFLERELKPIKVISMPDVTDEHRDCINIICTFINKNRINNVLSKLTSTEKENINRVYGMIYKDALDDYLIEGDKTFYQKNKSLIIPQVNKYINMIYKDNISNTSS